MDTRGIFSSLLLLTCFNNLLTNTRGEIREILGKNKTSRGSMHRSNFANNIMDTLKNKRKDKKSFINKKLQKLADTEKLKEFIDQIDSTGILRRVIRRKVHIPEDSSFQISSQVSRPNIFPNIFNQGEGFIVDAVIEWPFTLDLHKFGEAMQMERVVSEGKTDADDDGGVFDDDDIIPFKPLNGSSGGGGGHHHHSNSESKGKAFPSPSEIIGLERCLIYEKLETGMSLYLDINRNQSRDCVLRAVCEAQLVADYYPDAPTSIFFEVVHLILKPSLNPTKDPCYEVYLNAEKAAYISPHHCSTFVSKCPLNIAGLFVRNFFPEIL